MKVNNLQKEEVWIRFAGFLLLIAVIILLIVSLEIEISSFFSIRISLSMIAKDLLYSLLRVTVTALAGWLIAIPIGALLNNNHCIRELTTPVINMIRHISPFAWFPFAIIWFGLGEKPTAFILFITLFFPALIATRDSFGQIPKEYLDEAKVCGANMLQLFFYIEVPMVVIPLINLLRILWGLGWTMVIAAEMLGTAAGLGYRLLDFRYLLYYREMVIYIVIMGIIGVVIDYGLVKLADKFRI